MNIVVLTTIWSLFTATLYALSSLSLFRQAFDRQTVAPQTNILPAIIAAGSHGLLLFTSIFTNDAININLGLALSIVSWSVVVMFLMGLRKQPIATLGIIILPFATITVVLSTFFPGPDTILEHVNVIALSHTMIAIAAYALLTLAFCQAVLIIIQERHFQNKTAGPFFHTLPSMDLMESILFKIVIAGFTLLTITLISGSFFSQQIFGKPFTFTHHTVLSSLGWIAFGALLIARYIWGWRGRAAAIWSISSFILLMLAYFGSRFVFEIILNK